MLLANMQAETDPEMVIWPQGARQFDILALSARNYPQSWRLDVFAELQCS